MSLLLLFAGASSGSAPVVTVADAGGSHFTSTVSHAKFRAVSDGPFLGNATGVPFAGPAIPTPFSPVRRPFRRVE